MATLHRKLVQDQHVLGAQQLHLQSRIPGQEGIGFWPGTAQMFGCVGEQTPHHKGSASRQLDKLCVERHQGSRALSCIRTAKGGLEVAGHQLEPCRSRASAAPR